MLSTLEMFTHGRKWWEREREEENFAFIEGSSLGTINCEYQALEILVAT